MSAPDPFTTARSEFAGLGDFAGRAVLVVPTELQTGIPSTRPGAANKTYDRVIADVIVLDGGSDEDLGIDELPATFEQMFISGSVVVPQLRGAVKSRKPVLGVVAKQKSQIKGNNDAVVLKGDEVSEDQKALARRAWTEYQKAQEDPFTTG